MRLLVPGSLVVVLVLGLMGAPSLVGIGDGPASQAAAQVDLPRLHERYAEHFPIGVAIDERETTGASGELTRQQFNQITAENHMKPDAWYTGPGEFRVHPQATAMMDFAQEHDLRVYGHVLVWHSQTPDWFFEDDAGRDLTDSADDQDVLRQRMRDHIFAVAEALSDTYGPFGSTTNPLVAWDVVNEVISDDSQYADGLRRSPWYEVLGEEFIALAFRYADEAFNDVYAAEDADRPITLFINDYSTEWPDKQARYHALIERLLAEDDVPIDGVGHQFHVSVDFPGVSSLDAAIRRFQGMGLVQAVTELDVGVDAPASEADLAEQGRYYGDAFEVFRTHADDLYSVSVWGLHDGRTWRGSAAPLLFDADLEPKPAFDAVADAGAETTLTATLSPSDPDGQQGWYVSPVAFALEASRTDAAAEWRHVGEDDSWYPYIDPLVLASDGIHVLEYRLATDSGSAGTVEEATVRVDRTPPVTTASLDGTDQGRATGPVTLSLDATDATSGVDATHVRSVGDDDHTTYDGPITYDAPGTYDLEVRSQDIAGNLEDWRPVTFEIAEEDTTPPTTARSVCEGRTGGNRFVDAPGSGHGAVIECLGALGVVEGDGDGRFHPGDEVSRGQLASFVVRAVELATGESMPAGSVSFSDVARGSTHGLAITKLRNAGIIQGYPDGTFRPRDPVTRDQTARYVVNAVEHVTDAPLPTSATTFPDVASGNRYAADIDKLVTSGVVQGFPDGTYGPRQQVTRGQMARFIARSLDVLAEQGAYRDG